MCHALQGAKLRRGDRDRPEQLVRTGTTPQRVVERARIVLASSAGVSGNVICEQVGVSRPTVTLWLDRYEATGVDAVITNRPRSGRPKQITASDEEAMIKKTLESRPPNGTH